MRFSRGERASDAYPVLYETSFVDFSTWIRQHPRVQSGITPERYGYLKSFPSKSPEGIELHNDKSGPYVALAEFRDSYRHLDNVVASWGVPLDFDTGKVTYQTIVETLHGYNFVAETTYAHGFMNVPRWRVFVPVDGPMNVAQHYATWHMLSNAFPGGADPAAKDPSRLSYLPGKCLYPDQAQSIHIVDGVFLRPAPVIEVISAAPAPHGDGPVPGWAGPIDDETLIAIACSLRMRPDERFGGPVHFAALWSANEDWLGRQFPPSASEQGQAYSRTQADMALAGELAYFTGNDEARMRRLMLASGLCRPDDDWQSRKMPRAVERAIGNASKWHFMQPPSKVPPPPVEEMTVSIGEVIYRDPATGEGVTSHGVLVPPPPVSATDAALANAMPGLNDYWAYHPNGQFIHRPTGMLHVASTVDGTIGKDARAALVSSRPVHVMAWAPGMGERFQMRELDVTNERGAGAWCYNQFQPLPSAKVVGDPSPWLKLWEHCYPDTMHHALRWMADRRQNPGKKCAHALVLGSGNHGLGKDTLLLPLQHAVGVSNFSVISPENIFDDFDPWKKSIVLLIAESRDMDNAQRYALYEKTKILLAAPPKFLTCNEKHVKQQQVQNVLGAIFTTNHETDALYLPPDDRRHYCMWSNAQPWDPEEYRALYRWFYDGGLDICANYLDTLDLSTWQRDERPPKTDWWHTLVNAALPAEDLEFSDAVDKLGRPEWLTLAQIAQAAGPKIALWLQDPGNRRKIERRVASVGYSPLRNPNEQRGRWFIEGQKVTLYVRKGVNTFELMKKFGYRGHLYA